MYLKYHLLMDHVINVMKYLEINAHLVIRLDAPNAKQIINMVFFKIIKIWKISLNEKVNFDGYCLNCDWTFG